MKSLADALVYTVAYINCLPDPDEEHLDEDVDALEDIAACLKSATEEEKDALAAAAQRAFAQEQAGLKRPDYMHVYASWMEDAFGEDWQGNQRVAQR